MFISLWCSSHRFPATVQVFGLAVASFLCTGSRQLVSAVVTDVNDICFRNVIWGFRYVNLFCGRMLLWHIGSLENLSVNFLSCCLYKALGYRVLSPRLIFFLLSIQSFLRRRYLGFHLFFLFSIYWLEARYVLKLLGGHIWSGSRFWGSGWERVEVE